MNNVLDVCFTGHRPNKLGGYDWNNPTNQRIYKTLKEVVICIIKDNLPKIDTFNFITGGALGVDQMAFEIVYWLKQHKHSDITINLILAMPFEKQASAWRELDKEKLRSQMNRADKVVLVDTCDGYMMPDIPVGEYHVQKLQNRNEYMVDNASLVVAVWDGTKGGTANCVNYAKKQGKPVITINPLT